MSGGHYDYAFSRINDLAASIGSDIYKYRKSHVNSYGDTVDAFPYEVISRMESLQRGLEVVSEQAHALEWLMSDDIGLDTFIERYDAAEME